MRRSKNASGPVRRELPSVPGYYTVQPRWKTLGRSDLACASVGFDHACAFVGFAFAAIKLDYRRSDLAERAVRLSASPQSPLRLNSGTLLETKLGNNN